MVRTRFSTLWCWGSGPASDPRLPARRDLLPIVRGGVTGQLVHRAIGRAHGNGPYRGGRTREIVAKDFEREAAIVLPEVEASGLVLNIPEMRLYDFRAEPLPDVYAVAVECARQLLAEHLFQNEMPLQGEVKIIPDLVRALGGDPGPPIGPLEYDRLYLVILRRGQTQTLLLRFGESFAVSGN